MFTVLFSFLFLAVGLIGGWLGAERYAQYLAFNEHEFQELFDENPHPELYDAEGKIFQGEYMVLNFPPDFDPELDSWIVEDPDQEL